MARAPLSVAFFGEFGTENLGNDGTLSAVLGELVRRRPEVEPFVVCVHPEPVEQALGVRAVSVSGPRLTERGPRRPGTLLNRVGSKLVDPLWMAWCVRDAAAVVVPGTGLFEDADSLKPWSTPWMLAGMAAGARVRGIPLAFFGIGVSPPTSRVKAGLFRFALRSASFRSYRDTYSRDAATAMGVATAGDPVHPDPCYVLPPSPHQRGAAGGSIGLGVMHYHGDSADPDEQARAARAYEDAVTEIGTQLVDRGHTLRLLIGESRDAAVADRVAARVLLAHPTAGDRVAVDRATDLAGLLDAMSGLDAVVATRYHNVVCALLSSVPTVALVYAPKNREAMGWVAREADSYDVDGLQPSAVVERIETLFANRDRIGDEIAHRVAEFPKRVGEQLDTLVARILPTARAVRERTHAR